MLFVGNQVCAAPENTGTGDKQCISKVSIVKSNVQKTFATANRHLSIERKQHDPGVQLASQTPQVTDVVLTTQSIKIFCDATTNPSCRERPFNSNCTDRSALANAAAPTSVTCVDLGPKPSLVLNVFLTLEPQNPWHPVGGVSLPLCSRQVLKWSRPAADGPSSTNGCSDSTARAPG